MNIAIRMHIIAIESQPVTTPERYRKELGRFLQINGATVMFLKRGQELIVTLRLVVPKLDALG